MFQECDELEHDDTFINLGLNFADKNTVLKQEMNYIPWQCPDFGGMTEANTPFNSNKASVCLLS